MSYCRGNAGRRGRRPHQAIEAKENLAIQPNRQDSCHNQSPIRFLPALSASGWHDRHRQDRRKWIQKNLQARSDRLYPPPHRSQAWIWWIRLYKDEAANGAPWPPKPLAFHRADRPASGGNHAAVGEIKNCSVPFLQNRASPTTVERQAGRNVEREAENHRPGRPAGEPSRSPPKHAGRGTDIILGGNAITWPASNCASACLPRLVQSGGVATVPTVPTPREAAGGGLSAASPPAWHMAPSEARRHRALYPCALTDATEQSWWSWQEELVKAWAIGPSRA